MRQNPGPFPILFEGDIKVPSGYFCVHDPIERAALVPAVAKSAFIGLGEKANSASLSLNLETRSPNTERRRMCHAGIGFQLARQLMKRLLAAPDVIALRAVVRPL